MNQQLQNAFFFFFFCPLNVNFLAAIPSESLLLLYMNHIIK